MKYRHRVLGFLFFLAIITYIDRVCISVAGTAIKEDLGLSSTQWGWVMGAFIIAYGMFEVPSGAMGDRVGPRRVLTRIVAWWSGFTMLTGAVTNFWQMVVVRFLFGAGEAGAFPNASATIARWFPLRERARAQGFVWMASRLGGALAPVLVIPLQHAFGWRMSFLVFGVAGLVWAVTWYLWFRDTPREKAGVSEAECREIAEGNPTGAQPHLPWRELLRHRNLWWIMLMYGTYSWSGYFYLTWLYLFLENGRGYSAAELVSFSWLPFVFGAVANLLGGAASDALVKRIGLKWGRRLLGIGGLAASAVFIACAFGTQDKVWTVIFLALGYAGSDFMLPVAWAVCLDVGGRHAGAVTGAMNMAGQVGAFSTTVIFGYVVTATGSYDAPLIPMVVMTTVAALLWFKIDPTKPLVAQS